MKYVFITEFFESSSVAMHMKLLEQQDVAVVVTDKAHHKILEGIIDKEDNYLQFVGKGNIFVTDDAASGKLADELRRRGELVFGGSEESDKMENEREYGMKTAKSVGMNIPEYHPFKGHDAFDKAEEFIRSSKKQWVLKQQRDINKAYNTVSKFPNNEDLLDKISDFRHLWTHDIDFILQEKKEGHEVACSGYFNGNNWVRGPDGSGNFILNLEHKKQLDKDFGPTTGETGTSAVKIGQNTPLANELKKLTPVLRRIKYVGNWDVNFILEGNKLWFLEHTARWGYPSLNYEQELWQMPWGEFIEKTVRGENNFHKMSDKWVVVIVVYIPPFPFEGQDNERGDGQRVYFMEDGKWSGRDSLDLDKLKHIHPYELKFEKETKHFLASGSSGYLLTVTAQGETPETANKSAMDFIKANVYTANMGVRTDIGINNRVKEGYAALKAGGFI